jgi:hypothetical protein
MSNVIEAINLIYPSINGGFVYFESKSDGSSWDNPIDGLIWENQVFTIPTWEQIESKFEQIDLQNAKDGKIKELKIFHESDPARILTINNTFQVSTNFESTRKWFNEIISDLKNEAYVTSASYTAVKFDWEISTGVWIPLNLDQLCQFKYAVFSITKTNFKQYRTHIKAIEALSSVEDINNYDFTQGYLLDNQLTFDL